jgi:hypothetical protein
MSFFLTGIATEAITNPKMVTNGNLCRAAIKEGQKRKMSELWPCVSSRTLPTRDARTFLYNCTCVQTWQHSAYSSYKGFPCPRSPSFLITTIRTLHLNAPQSVSMVLVENILPTLEN